MFKLAGFLAVLAVAFAAPQPGIVGTAPVAYSTYYSSPVAYSSYSAPLTYSTYTHGTPLTYSTYTAHGAPLAYSTHIF